MCATLTYTALSSWHKYLISPHSNVLMIDFSNSVSGNLSHRAQKASEWLISSMEKCLSDFQDDFLLLRLLNFKRMRQALVGHSLFAEKIADTGYKWLQSQWDNCVDIQTALLRHLCEEIGWKSFKCWLNDKQNSGLWRRIPNDGMNRIGTEPRKVRDP